MDGVWIRKTPYFLGSLSPDSPMRTIPAIFVYRTPIIYADSHTVVAMGDATAIMKPVNFLALLPDLEV